MYNVGYNIVVLISSQEFLEYSQNTLLAMENSIVSLKEYSWYIFIHEITVFSMYLSLEDWYYVCDTSELQVEEKEEGCQ